MAKIIYLQEWKVLKQVEELNRSCSETDILLDYMYDFMGLVRENHEIEIRESLGNSLMDAIARTTMIRNKALIKPKE